MEIPSEDDDCADPSSGGVETPAPPRRGGGLLWALGLFLGVWVLASLAVPNFGHRCPWQETARSTEGHCAQNLAVLEKVLELREIEGPGGAPFERLDQAAWEEIITHGYLASLPPDIPGIESSFWNYRLLPLGRDGAPALACLFHGIPAEPGGHPRRDLLEDAARREGIDLETRGVVRPRTHGGVGSWLGVCTCEPLTWVARAAALLASVILLLLGTWVPASRP